MLQKLLSYEYLLEPIPGRPAQFRILYIVLALGTCCSFLGMAALQGKHHPKLRRTLQVEAVLALLALSLTGCAFVGMPLLSMRILVFGANLLALSLPLVVWVRLSEPVDVWARQRRAWSGQLDMVQPLLPRYTSLLLVGAHLVGLILLSAHLRWPLWWSLLLLLGLLSPQWLFSLSTRRWRVHLEALAPLFLPYGVLVARVLLLTAAKLLLGYPQFSLPSVADRLLNVNLALLVALPWSFFSQVYAILRYRRRSQILLPAAAAGWLLLTFAWASYTYIHHRTRGVTGTDPYCYAQMAVDLVATYLPVHRFPLAIRMKQLGVFAEAGVHLGYHLPFDASGWAATVWPVGQSVLLAVGYRLAGEGGLYLTTPVLGLLSLAVLAALSWELWSPHPLSDRLLASAVSVFLLATSYAQIERVVVPMADAAAQLFTALTVLLWLRATRDSRGRTWAFLAGLSLGAAYLVRHTQLVLAASVLWLAWVGRSRSGHKTGRLALFALGALCFAVPDLVYHQWVMGHWLRPESLELQHFALAFMGRMGVRMASELFSAREFLYVSPLLVYGLWRQWREDKVHCRLLSSWLIAVLLVHLPYEALRLRDLLSLFPVLCLWAGYGVVGLWRQLQAAGSRQQAADSPPPCSLVSAPCYLNALVYAWLLAALLLLRTRSTLGLPHAADFDTFGHLNAFQRAGFAQIGQDTEETALIGVSLNSGAVELHSKRTAFRPAVWRGDEFYAFVDDTLARGVPLYLLEDGLEMAAPVATAGQRYELQLVGRYDIPFYHTGGGSTGGRVPLYCLRVK